MNGKQILKQNENDAQTEFFYSLGYQSFMLSLKSQISVLDNFVIREESISPVLAMMSKESTEHAQNSSDGSIREVMNMI